VTGTIKFPFGNFMVFLMKLNPFLMNLETLFFL
jgi:hypothetical protein